MGPEICAREHFRHFPGSKSTRLVAVHQDDILCPKMITKSPNVLPEVISSTGTSPRAFQISNMEHFSIAESSRMHTTPGGQSPPENVPQISTMSVGVILSTRNVLEMSEIIHGEHFAVQKVLMNVQMSPEPHFRGQKSSLRKLCSFGILYSRGHSGPPQHTGVYRCITSPQTQL